MILASPEPPAHSLKLRFVVIGLHPTERLMRVHGLKARPRRRGLPKDDGLRSIIADKLLDRQSTAEAANMRARSSSG